MTVEEAKKIARLEDALEFMKKQSVLEQVVSEDDKSRHFSLAVKALEKQIPKKPHPKEKYNSGYAMHCPTCNNYICLEPHKRDIFPSNIANAYCRRCGQALDWGVAE